jgi:hypothetical protein
MVLNNQDSTTPCMTTGERRRKTGSSDLPVGRLADGAVESFISDFPKNICSL